MDTRFGSCPSCGEPDGDETTQRFERQRALEEERARAAAELKQAADEAAAVENLRRVRDRNRAILGAIVEAQPKYAKPLAGEGFATFSLVGTRDWEDYASLAVRLMQLESLSALDERMERLEARLATILEHLEATRSRSDESSPG